jgi:hypothetical protein
MKARLRFLGASSAIVAALSAQICEAQTNVCAVRQQAMEQTAQNYRDQYDGYQHEGEDLRETRSSSRPT